MKRLRLVVFVLSVLLLAAVTPGPGGAARADGGTQYYIEVDISNQIVTVYDASSMYILRQMLCSTGMKSNWTPMGDFVLPKDEKRTDRDPWYQIGDYFVRYATRISGQILFHSIPYTRKSVNSLDPSCVKQFGYPASHGCVRLRWQDAQYIAENCPAGTRVKIMQSGKRNDELRALLFQESFDIEKGLSYENFLGISSEPGVMDRHSGGQEVLNLQYRLRDLGLYDGALNGDYDSATVNAVRAAQYLLGLDTTGMASPAFLSTIYGEDAPTAMNVRLKTGMSGPAVRRLQANLSVLKLYKGDLDSVYDVDVVEAVKAFQRVYCYDQDGVATPEVQKALAYEAENVNRSLGGLDYVCGWDSEPVRLARVKAEAGLSLKRSASQDGGALKVLPTGATVVVLDAGKDWSRVNSGGQEGYVASKFVSFFEQDVYVLQYTCPDNNLSYTLGNRASDYYGGADLPCNMFDDYLAVNDQPVDVDSLVSYVTVQTGDASALLNLREAPDADSAVLNTVGDGSSLKVQRRYSEWTQVTYQGQSGYLMNRYLSFWTGPQDALDGDPGDGEVVSLITTGKAVVASAAGGPAGVYAGGFNDAQVLGHLSDGVELEVLETAGGWCHIRYEGHEGYMFAEDLQFEQLPEDNRLVEELRV